jgi:hypothetical protein
MNLILIRNIYTPVNTIGDLLVNHKIICHTLEDVVRPDGSIKVPGQTAIKAGRYRITFYLSPKRGRILPLLHDVPDFDFIEMHGGNTAKDTSGCIIVSHNIINDSMVQGTAEPEVTELLRMSNEENFIEILNTFPYTGISP